MRYIRLVSNISRVKKGYRLQKQLTHTITEPRQKFVRKVLKFGTTKCIRGVVRM